jgi:Spy/CpxP family protein refolding chaperone
MATPFLARFSFAALATLLFTFVVTSPTHAQGAPAPAQASGSTQSQSQTPQKKVWTNDNLGVSHSQEDDSSATAQPALNSGSTVPAKSKSRKDAKWYHDQIAKLQAQIPPLDKSIAELQAALDGKTLNEPPHYGGNRIGGWKEQLQQLQTKRQDTLDKITALEDEARHNGVATNALP